MLNNLGRYSIEASHKPQYYPRNNDRQAVTASYGTQRGRHKAQADGIGGLLGNSGAPATGFSTTGANIVGNYAKGVIDDFLNPEDLVQIRRIYKDIYYHDIAGCAIDLLSTLPWSDFSLTSLPDAEQFEVYVKSIDSLNFKSLLPELSVDYLTNGAHVSVLNFDQDARTFTSIMPQDINLCKIIDLPVYNMDPLIDLEIPPNTLKLIQQAKKDKRLEEFTKKIPDFIMNQMKKGRVELNPANTLYVPRRTLSSTQIGTSYLRRLLPVYIYEKALIRGTVETVYKRQRGILHLVLGDGDGDGGWEPTPEEMTAYANMFISADVDPTGAVVATRQGVQPNVINVTEGMWRWDESWQTIVDIKMKMLGINESLLSGDSTFNTLEVALSVFVEQLRAYRDMITRKVFYSKIFPALAVANDFFRPANDKHIVTGELKRTQSIKQRYSNRMFRSESGYTILCDGSNYVPDMKGVDISEYYLPKINWHKALKPEADREYMDVLNTLQAHGVPIGLRQWAAAGGVSIHELMGSLDDDIAMRKKVAAYQKKLPKDSTPSAGEGSDENDPSQESGGEDGDNYQEQSSLRELASPGSMGNRLKRKGVLARDYTRYNEEVRDGDTGKILSQKGRKVLNDKINKTTATALARIARRENYNTRKGKKNKTMVHGFNIFGKT